MRDVICNFILSQPAETMSETSESAVSKEVAEFLKRRKQNYISLLTVVSEELRRFKNQPSFHDVIYRIYSRADKQIGGDPLKAEWKIAKKLSDLRVKKPSTQPIDIHDIIGVTVVTYFTSQREIVAKTLESPNVLGELEIGQREEKKEKGYYAIHFVASTTKLPLRGLLCEIQVKTLLDDGWATKTHDITYKPKSGVQVNPELQAQIDILGDSIRLIERQSDIVRKLIEHESSRDKKRRTAAQQELLLALTEVPRHHEDFHVRKWTEFIVKNLRKDVEGIKSCDQSSDILKKYLEIWNKLVKQGRHTIYSCRLITLLASLRDGGELNNDALDAIAAWIGSTANDRKETVCAYAFRALANYTFGLFPEAVLDAETALQHAELENENILTGKVKMSLAYFIAEEFYHTPAARSRAKNYKRAKRLLSEAKSSFTRDGRAQFDDTCGAVAITFSKKEPEIRRGLQLCHQALVATVGTPDREAAEAFYRLHEHRACHKLLAWE